MAAFVPLPNPANPYASEASSFASGAGGIYNTLQTQLATSARQQAQQAASKQRAEEEMEERLRASGNWIQVQGPEDPGRSYTYPTNDPGAPPGQERPTLESQRTSAPIGLNRPGFEKEQALSEGLGRPFFGYSSSAPPVMSSQDAEGREMPVFSPSAVDTQAPANITTFVPGTGGGAGWGSGRTIAPLPPESSSQVSESPSGRPTLKRDSGASVQPSAAPAQAAPSAASAQPTPSGRDPARMMKVNGKWFYRMTPAEAEEAKLNNTNSFTPPPGSDAAKYMADLGVPPGTKIPFSHLAALGNLHNEMMKAAEAAEKRGQVFTLSQSLSDKLHEAGIEIPAGTKLPSSQAEALKRAATPLAPKPERKETQDDWIRIITDPASDPKEVQRATAALKLLRQGQDEADKDRHERQAEHREDVDLARQDRQERVLRELEGKKDDENTKALNVYYQTVHAGASMADYKNAKTGEDPEETVKARARARLQAAIDANQSRYETGITSVTKQKVPHNDWGKTFDPDSPGGAPPAQTQTTTPAQSRAAPAQQGSARVQPKPAKTATAADIRAYAQRAGISEAEALRRAKAEGYTIGGQ